MKNYFKRRLMSILEKEELELSKNEDLEELLDEIEELAWYYPWHRYDYVRETERLERIENKLDTILENSERKRCRFSESDSDSALQFITGIGLNERNKAIAYLSEKLIGAKSLSICDPYFLKKPKDAPPAQAAAEFIGILPTTLQSLNLYVKPRIRDKDFSDYLNSMLKERGVKLLVRKTEDVHDRVWVKDYEEAFVVGTSFNGLGNKCAFILDLPSEDRKQFIYSLNELSQKLSKSKSA
ncbi:hypothetical protein D3C79_520980 [compost metagenome]